MTRWYVGLLVVQALSPSPQQILREDRPLSAAEVSVVLDAARSALRDHTFRFVFPSDSLTPDAVTADVLMGTDGRPRITRVTYTPPSLLTGGNGRPPAGLDGFTAIEERTGQDARRCDG